MDIANAWPWIALAGLGTFHGLNPAMGWLFAVALGLHRRSRQAVLLSLLPIALGHALSISLVAASVVAIGAVADAGAIRRAAGAMLVLWAAYHWLYDHRHRVRVGMTTGLAGLVLWSFLMATGHGAGLMLVPALMPLCAGGATAGAGSLLMAAAATGVHTAAMLAVTGVVALAVHDWLGLAVLRQGWINFDLLWSGALIATGLAIAITA
ncbi:MAG TPA: hypothetical protein VE684_00685 [Crenalkalicoccus sp.]|nr:hypothetical protein [Crenalkalicoccus sp.]